MPDPIVPFDYAVIGAGAIGAAIAYRLAAEGHSVVLVDRNDPGTGASFGNAGMIATSEFVPMASAGNLLTLARMLTSREGALRVTPDYLLPLLPWGLKFIQASLQKGKFARSLQAMAGLCLPSTDDTEDLLAEIRASELLVRNNYLRLFRTREEYEAQAAGWALKKAQGQSFSVIEGASVARLLPQMARDYGVAVEVDGYHHLRNPKLYVDALVAAAKRRGAAHRTTGIRRIETGAEHLRLTTDGNEPAIAARQAVVACGAHSAALARSVGDRFPLETQRGYHLHYPNPGIRLDRSLSLSDLGLAVTPMEDSIRISSFVEFAGTRRAAIERRFDTIAKKAALVFPQLDHTQASRWMGHRPSLPDGLPVIGRSPSDARVAYCFGHGQVGITTAASSAKLMMSLLKSNGNGISENAFCASRF